MSEHAQRCACVMSELRKSRVSLGVGKTGQVKAYEINLSHFPSAEYVDPARVVDQDVLKRLDELCCRDLDLPLQARQGYTMSADREVVGAIEVTDLVTRRAFLEDGRLYKVR